MEDIDKFLDKNLPQKKPSEEKPKQSDSLNSVLSQSRETNSRSHFSAKLDLKTPISKQLEKFDKKSESKDFSLLKKMYDELRRFNKHLPQDFLDVENRTYEVLDVVTSNYTKKMVEQFNRNINNLENYFNERFELLKSHISTSSWQDFYNDCKQLKSHLPMFPQQALLVKLKWTYKITQIEKEFYIRVEQDKRNMQSFKRHLEWKLNHFTEKFKEGSLHEKQELVERLEGLLGVYRGGFDSFIPLRIKALNFIESAKRHIQTQRAEEFSIKSNEIRRVFTTLHNSILSKDLNYSFKLFNIANSLISQVSEEHFAQKSIWYQRLTYMKHQINNLCLNLQISSLFENYNQAKALSNAREIIEQSRRGFMHSQSTIQLAINSIQNLPESNQGREVVRELKMLQGVKNETN